MNDKLMLLIKITAGNFLMAAAVNAFILPFEFISGGSTGLALLMSHYLPMGFSAAVTCITVLCFVLGFLFMGKAFALTTLLSSIVYPLFTDLLKPLQSLSLVTDPMLAAILAGLVMGTGLGMVLQSGASTGGLDIPPLIIQKYFHIPVTYTLFAMEVVLLLAQIPYSSMEQVAAGITISAVTMFWMNRILVSGKAAVQVMVISTRYEQIRNILLEELDKGATLFEAQTGYRKIPGKAICSVFPARELTEVRRAVQKIDPSAFMIVSSVQEVRGLGFEGWNQI